MQESIELYVYFASAFCLCYTHTYIHTINCLPVHICIHMQAIYTNLNMNFKLVYKCSVGLLEPEGEKLPQNPKGLNGQHLGMDVKKPKPWALRTGFSAGIYQQSCLSPTLLCPGETLLRVTCWHNKSVVSYLLPFLGLKNNIWNGLIFVILLPGCCCWCVSISLYLVQIESDAAVWLMWWWVPKPCSPRYLPAVGSSHRYKHFWVRTSELI